MKTSVVIAYCAAILTVGISTACAQAPSGNWCGTTPAPAADAVGLPYNASRDVGIAGINQRRAAERLPPLALPSNYAQLPDDQKLIVLINLERTARGLSPFNSGNPQLSGNDPVFGYVATNHSALLQQSLALYPGFPNPNGGSVWHDNSIEGIVRERLSMVPGFQGGVSAWNEIIASESPESAVYQWMYQDAGADWGHRGAILGITSCYTSAGAGFAPPMGGRTECASGSPPCRWIANTGAKIFIVEFVRGNNSGAGYKPPVISASAPRPVGQKMTKISVTESSQPGSIDVQLSATYDATVYGLPNDIRQVWIYPTATWGKQVACPAGTTCPARMGQIPFGAGAFPCPVTKGTDPKTPSYSCAATVPSGNGPLGTGPVIVALDNYGNAIYHDASYVFLPPAAP